MTILVSFLVAASVAFPSVSAADLFNLLGIGGVAIGFAFRDVLQNLLAGILILLTRPLRHRRPDPGRLARGARSRTSGSGPRCCAPTTTSAS